MLTFSLTVRSNQLLMSNFFVLFFSSFLPAIVFGVLLCDFFWDTRIGASKYLNWPAKWTYLHAQRSNDICADKSGRHTNVHKAGFNKFK